MILIKMYFNDRCLAILTVIYSKKILYIKKYCTTIMRMTIDNICLGLSKNTNKQYI